MGTEAVLKAALRYRAKVLLASTSEVYGKGNHVPFNEEDDVVLGPTSRSRWAYAVSKMVDEFLALAYHREKDLPVVVFRLFNTVGPRQTGQYGMVIPRFAQQALMGENLNVFGDGLQSRCFLHVSDAVEAILALADCREAVGKVFNVGGVEEITIRELAQKILALTHQKTGIPADKPSGERIAYIPYDQAYAVGFEDMRQRVPDISLVKQYTDWTPKHTLDDVLLDVLDEQLSSLGSPSGDK
jgi:UDP-glucose 4-epimerase